VIMWHHHTPTPGTSALLVLRKAVTTISSSYSCPLVKFPSWPNYDGGMADGLRAPPPSRRTSRGGLTSSSGTPLDLPIRPGPEASFPGMRGE
jgi:hypothetical protein